MDRMVHIRALHAACAAAAVLAVAACGSGSSSTPPPTSHRGTPTPAPTPTPPPDTLSVAVSTTGVGAWQLVAVPVAVLHNTATRHGAKGVVVHFTTFGANGKPQHTLNSVAVNLPPAATVAVTADCTDVCNDAASASATVDVTSWVESAGIGFTGSATSYACSAGCGGRQSGEVSATITASGTVASGSPVAVFAQCVNSAGGIIGGGASQLMWPGGSSAPVNVSAIVNRQPASCSVSASTGW